MKYFLAVGLLAALVVLAACESGAQAVSISGPASVTEGERSVLTATAEGAAPLFGAVEFMWYIDANDNPWPNTDEILETYTSDVSALGTAVHSLQWTVREGIVPENGGFVEVSVQANFFSPGSDEYTYKRDTHEVWVNSD